MEYIVWVKREFQDLWDRVECDTVDDVRTRVLEATKEKSEVVVTQPVDYEIKVNIINRYRPPEKPAQKPAAQEKTEDEKHDKRKAGSRRSDKGPDSGRPGNQSDGPGDTGTVQGDG